MHIVPVLLWRHMNKYLKTQATGLFVQHNIQDHNKENIKALHFWTRLVSSS